MFISGVESLEIHEGDGRLWAVYTHGDACEHLRFLVNRIEGDAAAQTMFADPNSEAHGDRYSEVVFDDPQTVEVVNDALTY